MNKSPQGVNRINSFIRFMLNHSKLVIFVTVLTTIFMAYQATKIEMDTNFNNLMPQKTKRTSLIREKLGVETELSNYLFLSIAGDSLFNLETLGAFQSAIDSVMEIPGFDSVLNPFNFVHFESSGGRIIPGTMSPSGRAPGAQDELDEFRQRILNQSLSENFVVADEGRVLTAMFLNRFSNNKAQMADFTKAIEPLESVTEVHFTGEMPFRDRVAYYLSKDFSFLLVLALAAMLAIFWFSFRSVRSVVLPVLVVVVGAIWSLGLMSMMGFPVTVVSVIIPSLILTMGSSYTIHVMNEYYRNLQEDHEVTDKKQWLADAVEHAIRTVIVAALTTIVCFISLLTTTLQPLQEFGLSISLGIFFCAILALFFLPAVFVLLPAPKRHNRERIHNGFLTKTALNLGTWSHRHPFLITAVFIAFFAGTLLVYPHIRHQSDYFSYFPSEDRIIKDTNFINRYSGGSQTFNITLKAPDGKKGYFLDPDILKTLDGFEAGLTGYPAVTNKLSFLGILKSMNSTVTGNTAVPESRGLILLLDRYFRMIPTGKFALGQGSSLISEDGSSVTIYLKLAEAVTYNMINEDGVRDFISFVENRLESDFGDTLSTYLWGNTVLLLDSSRVIMRDQLRSTALSMLLGIIITAIVFRSVTFSFFAIIPLFSGMFWYFVTLYFSRIPMDLTTILVTNVTVGVGLDNAVHFILQYRIQRSRKNWEHALADSLKITGRPIVLTTISLVAGLTMLCFASFKPVIYFGYLVAGALFSTMIGTLVFIPVAIAFLEKIMEWKNRRNPVQESSAVLP